MKLLASFSVVAGICVVSGCNSGTEAQSLDPIGFTFQTADGSFFSFGWTGEIRNVETPEGTPFEVKVTECKDSVCRFEGPSDLASDVHRRRCLFRMSQTCDADSDCPVHDGTGTPCVYIYEPPFTTPLQGADDKVGACGWSYIPLAADGQPTIRGTLNLASNALDLENLTVLSVSNRRSITDVMPTAGFYGRCTECVGDVTPDDGLKQGTCVVPKPVKINELVDTGPDQGDLGMPCDVNRHGTDDEYSGDYSMDCSPTVDSVGRPLLRGGSFTSSGFQLSISEESPNLTTPGSSGKSFCGMCSDGATACMSNRNCPDGPNGKTCGWPATESDCDPNPPFGTPGNDPNLEINQCKKDSSPRKFAVGPNACVNEQCNWDPKTNQGSCMSKPPDSHPIGCYPSGAGATIVVPGRADRADNIGTIYFANTAGASCIPAGDNPALNSQVGLPGLFFQQRNFQIIPKYTEDQK